MKYVQFDYVNKFSCLAGKCPDTCCKDWQIILDEDAIARYASLPGELGEQVRAAMLTENGETRFRERGGNCVLLRDDGLCPLQAAYGAEMLCRTCFTHPRFTEEYGQTAELTLSASCPEAARLLLEHDAPLTLTETDDGGPVIPNELDPALYPALLAARTASIGWRRIAHGLLQTAWRSFCCWHGGCSVCWTRGGTSLSRCWRGGSLESSIRIVVLSGWRGFAAGADGFSRAGWCSTIWSI